MMSHVHDVFKTFYISKILLINYILLSVLIKSLFNCSHFGYYDEEGDVIPFYRRKIYTNDDIGLKTLYKEGCFTISEFDKEF